VCECGWGKLCARWKSKGKAKINKMKTVRSHVFARDSLTLTRRNVSRLWNSIFNAELTKFLYLNLDKYMIGQLSQVRKWNFLIGLIKYLEYLVNKGIVWHSKMYQ